MALQVFIDNDACPVKEEALRVAARYRLPVTLISNRAMRPIALANVTQIVVDARFDAADDWIAGHAAGGDIVVTADIVLAARCLAKGCGVLNPSGHIFTAQNIGAALSLRALNAHLRETGESRGYNPVFSKKDRSRFLQSLDLLIQKAR